MKKKRRGRKGKRGEAAILLPHGEERGEWEGKKGKEGVFPLFVLICNNATRDRRGRKKKRREKEACTGASPSLPRSGSKGKKIKKRERKEREVGQKPGPHPFYLLRRGEGHKKGKKKEKKRRGKPPPLFKDPFFSCPMVPEGGGKSLWSKEKKKGGEKKGKGVYPFSSRKFLKESWEKGKRGGHRKRVFCPIRWERRKKNGKKKRRKGRREREGGPSWPFDF